MKFGDNLKNIRKYKKISQEELAERLGVSRQSISKWETGENYPSMTNIMCLCDIFKCQINELVHEDMTDIDSLDEEIKMNVVKFKKDEQKKMKGISKFIYVVSNISNKLGFVILAMMVLVSFILIGGAASYKINKNASEITVFGEKINYVLEEGKISLSDGKETDVLARNLTDEEMKTVEKALDLPKGIIITLAVLISTSLVVGFIVIIKLTEYLYKLFKNIHDNDTPFNMDNVFYMKKLALYSLLYVLSSDVLGGIGAGISSLDFSIDIELQNYIVAVIILALSYVFKYGYEIQLDSKGKIYGDINE